MKGITDPEPYKVTGETKRKRKRNARYTKRKRKRNANETENGKRRDLFSVFRLLHAKRKTENAQSVYRVYTLYTVHTHLSGCVENTDYLLKKRDIITDFIL